MPTASSSSPLLERRRADGGRDRRQGRGRRDRRPALVGGRAASCLSQPAARRRHPLQAQLRQHRIRWRHSPPSSGRCFPTAGCRSWSTRKGAGCSGWDRPPGRRLPPARALGRLAEADGTAGERATRLHAAAIAALLRAVGIDVVCAPCLDLLRPETTRAIGDRALAADPALVARLGRIYADTLLAQGVVPVIKHLPGHGRATCDSHLELPRVTADVRRARGHRLAGLQAARRPAPGHDRAYRLHRHRPRASGNAVARGDRAGDPRCRSAFVGCSSPMI